MTTEHIRICKHRPHNECTHYQLSYNDKVDYLKCDVKSWYIWSDKNGWRKIDNALVRIIVKKPVCIDSSIKMERKYDWSNVPKNLNFIATNEDGFAFGYEGKPMSGYLHSGFWYGGGKYELILWSRENQFNDTNWRNSLEERI